MARAIGAEIVSVDSRQVYRGLDVGADKVSGEIRSEIPHHMLDICDPDRTFTVADFARECKRLIREIHTRGAVALLVGGTPYYYESLFSGIPEHGSVSDPEARKRLESRWKEEGPDALYEELKRVDPGSCSRIHPHDRYRVIRALEIFQATGRPRSDFHPSGHTGGLRPTYFGLFMKRERLYDLIEKRVKHQFASGFPQEVQSLLHRGCDPGLPALRGFGYRELVKWAAGSCSLEEAAEEDIRSTRAFCRRQMTWFRKFVPCLWYDGSDPETEDNMRNVMLSWRRRFLPGEYSV